MQIIALGVYSRDGRRRDVRFRRRALNILTGKSKTGKSAILDIVEFCLGRTTVTIPIGVSNHVSWYYLLVEIGVERILLCRPNPDGASTNRAMVRVGDSSLEPVPFEQLEINADTDVLRDTLTERLGIETYTIEPEAGSLRGSFDVSVRQALFYCFQKQTEIASQDVLFHRQVDNDIKATIRYTLPYFVGAATPEQAAIYRQLVAARRGLQRLQATLRTAEADSDEMDARISNLIRTAISLGVLSDGDTLNEPVAGLLQRVVEYRVQAHGHGGAELEERRVALDEEIRALRGRVREIDDRIELLTRLQSELTDAEAETGIQRDRLRAIDLMLPSAREDLDSAGTCPLCDQSLEEPDETIEDLREVLAELQRRLSLSRGSQTRRGAAIEGLRNDRSPLIEALGDVVAEREVVEQQEEAINEGRQLRERIAFLQGRVSQELDRGTELSTGLAELRDSERRARGQVARLEQLYEQDNPAANMRAAMDATAEFMTDYARFLQLEGSEFFVRLDPIELTVAIQEPGGRVPLGRMGSAENWVGYHLVAYLALHHRFITDNRPVPSFVMFDQPTQAFFPEEVVDAANDENADWEAVRRQFALMRDVATALDGQLQVIVCDHANLADEWFQDAVIDNWRNGVALIPEDWFASP